MLSGKGHRVLKIVSPSLVLDHIRQDRLNSLSVALKQMLVSKCPEKHSGDFTLWCSRDYLRIGTQWG